MGEYHSLQSQVGLILKSWLQTWIHQTQQTQHPNPDRLLGNLPLKRSPCSMPECPIVYQSALFPWLASRFPRLGSIDFWQEQTIVALEAGGFKELGLKELKLTVLPGHGLQIGVSGTAIVENLQQWLLASLDPLKPFAPALQQQLFAKTGDGCEIYYYHDRCRHLQTLAQRQGWLPTPLSWDLLSWNQETQDLWAMDSTGRSLLQAWSDQTDALLNAPHRLVTGLPAFLKCLDQYDRAHPWGALAQTLSAPQFWVHSALIAASDRFLDQVLNGTIANRQPYTLHSAG